MRVGAGADRVLGVVDAPRPRCRGRLRGACDERGDRSVALRRCTVRCSPSTSSCAVTVAPVVARRRLVREQLAPARPRGGTRPANASHISAGVISVPVSSVIVWIVLRELDLQPPRQVEAVLGLHDVGDAALARLAVDPDDRLVRAADVLRVDRQVRHLPRVVVAVAERLDALLDRVLVGAGERRVDEVADVRMARVDRQAVAVLGDPAQARRCR